MEPNIANRVISTPASFWEVPGSNLVLAARYPVIGFPCFSQSLQVSDETVCYLILATTASFHTFPFYHSLIILSFDTVAYCIFIVYFTTLFQQLKLCTVEIWKEVVVAYFNVYSP
jgi:hypothetical protein